MKERGGARRQWGRWKKGQCDVGSHSGVSKVDRLVERIRRACGHFPMEHPNIRVIAFSAFPEGSPEAFYTIPHGKQDFIAEEVATKMLSKVF